MDEVAAVAGASKVTVYKHFSGKQSLLVAVFTSAIHEAEAMFTGRDRPFPARYLNRYADKAVRVFVAAYAGPRR